MTDPREPADIADMERAASAMAEQIRRLAQVTRSLTSLRDAIEELRSAAGELAPAGAPPRSDPSKNLSPEQVPPPTAGADSREQETEDQTSTPTADAVNGAVEPAAPSARPEPVSVTVSCPDGSLDLVRVFRALQPMDGVADLNLLSYAGGRAVLQLVVYKPPQQIQLQDALADAFPEGITGDWIGPTEYVAVIAGTRRPF